MENNRATESEWEGKDPLALIDNILKTYQLEIKFFKNENLMLEKLMQRSLKFVAEIMGEGSASYQSFVKEYAELQAWRLKNSVVLMKEVSSLPASSTPDSLPELRVALEETLSGVDGVTPSIPGASAITQSTGKLHGVKSSITTNPGARKLEISNFLKSLIASCQRFLEKRRERKS
jgi:hypothetical protein